MIELFNEINSVLKFVDINVNKIIAEYTHITKIKLIKKYVINKNPFVKIYDNKYKIINNPKLLFGYKHDINNKFIFYDSNTIYQPKFI